MKSLLDRFVDWIRNESAPSPFAADVRVDTGFGICRGTDNLFRQKTPVIVVAFGDGTGAVVDGELPAIRNWWAKRR